LAVWKQEARRPSEVLMDAGRTKSWLMVKPEIDRTALYFGTVIVPERPKAMGEVPRIGAGFKAFMGLHTLYSKLLLQAAARRLT
jgi:hypothetical protein